jgi:hypothetical protein
VAAGTWIRVAEIALAKSHSRVHPSRKQAAAQGAIPECGDIVLKAIGQDLDFHVALEEVVRRQDDVKRSDAPEALDLGYREIADADRPDLALLQEHAHCVGRLFDRNQSIRPVDLVDIDVVRLQASQRLVDLMQDAFAAGITKGTITAPVETGFGCDHHSIPRAGCGDRFADDLLGVPETINGRGILSG